MSVQWRVTTVVIAVPLVMASVQHRLIGEPESKCGPEGDLFWETADPVCDDDGWLWRRGWQGSETNQRAEEWGQQMRKVNLGEVTDNR